MTRRIRIQYSRHTFTLAYAINIVLELLTAIRSLERRASICFTVCFFQCFFGNKKVAVRAPQAPREHRIERRRRELSAEGVSRGGRGLCPLPGKFFYF